MNQNREKQGCQTAADTTKTQKAAAAKARIPMKPNIIYVHLYTKGQKILDLKARSCRKLQANGKCV